MKKHSEKPVVKSASDYGEELSVWFSGFNDEWVAGCRTFEVQDPCPLSACWLVLGLVLRGRINGPAYESGGGK